MSSRGRKRGRTGGGEHENHERWLLTYADMITLLVAFFIMLYAMSVVNVQKFQQLAVSVRSGFGDSFTDGTPTIIPHGGGPEGAPSVVSNGHLADPTKQENFQEQAHEIAARHDAERLDKAYQVIQTFIRAHHLQMVMHAARSERGVVVTVMTDRMLFARGQADLRPEELGLLNEVAAVIHSVPNQVRVEGHTDSLPIHTARFPSNWELSVTRATTVLRYFEGQGVPSKRLEAAGYADQRPIVPNDTETNRGRNRRVDIVILKLY